MKNPKDFASAATLSMLSSRASAALIGPREAMTAGTSNSQREPWVMAEGTLQALKWGALLLMVLDHANKYLYAERLPVIFQVGRLVMPIFGFVLAYNLARPDALARGLHRRMMFRLALAGLAACPIVIILNGPLVSANPWWPLNILFTLWLVVAITFLIDRGGVGRCALALALLVVAGAFVEYLWMGLLCCLGAWAFCRDANVKSGLLWFLGTLSLTVVNGNAWALLAIPLILLTSRLSLNVPRCRWIFYAFYPVHLLTLLGARWAWF